MRKFDETVQFYIFFEYVVWVAYNKENNTQKQIKEIGCCPVWLSRLLIF